MLEINLDPGIFFLFLLTGEVWVKKLLSVWRHQLFGESSYSHPKVLGLVSSVLPVQGEEGLCRSVGMELGMVIATSPYWYFPFPSLLCGDVELGAECLSQLLGELEWLMGGTVCSLLCAVVRIEIVVSSCGTPAPSWESCAHVPPQEKLQFQRCFKS